MNGSIDLSVTLEDVFAVVNAKRVPLAPELAGYLSLEIAEEAQTLGPPNNVDARSVFIGEEGTVALIRAKDSSGDAETSVRTILARLLEASGSQTPALGAAARRKPGTGLRGLVEELEAALIPVNRAAGRRALARLAREVKRVKAGVGRNAPPPERAPTTRTSNVDVSPAAPQEDATQKTAGEAPKDEFPDLELVLPRGPRAQSPAQEPPPANPGELDTTAGAITNDAVDDLLANFAVSGATTDRAVSRELKAMVGLDPTPSPKTKTGAPEVDGIDDLLAMTERSVPIANVHTTTPRGVGPAAAPPAPIAMPAAASEPSPPRPGPVVLEPPPRPEAPTLAEPTATAQPAPPPARRTAPGEVGSPLSQRASYAAPARPGSRHAKTIVVRPRARRIDRILTVLTLVMLVGGVAAVWTLKPGFFTGRTPDKIEQERQAAAAASLQALANQGQPPCKGTLSIFDVPANAEVLMRVGQAPVDVERMPVGARLEFVATAEGYAPKRSIIPAGATWDPGADGRPRFELAVQLDPTKQKPGKEDPWPAGEPGSIVGGKGAPGRVHVVSTPRGAELWLLVGAGPEATIDPVRCEQDAEILLAGPTTYRKRLRVIATDIAKAPIGQSGGHTVRLSAKSF